MKIAYASDLHVDFWINELNFLNPRFKNLVDSYIENILRPPEADILIIAGDIGHYNKQNIEVLNKLGEYYKNIVVTFGNHDLYMISKTIQSNYDYNSFNRLSEFKQMCTENGIHFLDGDNIVIDGVRIAGGGMWYDIDGDISGWKSSTNDAVYIMEHKPLSNEYQGMYGALIPNHNTGFDCEKFYKNEVKKLENISECDVFVSHVIPVKLPPSLLPKSNRLNNRYRMMYESDNLELLKKIKAKYCIFGHSHTLYNNTYENINFLSSCIGYKSEKLNHKIEVFNVDL